jgi:hypothetical protein
MTQDDHDPAHSPATAERPASAGEPASGTEGGSPRPVGWAKFDRFVWFPGNGPSWTDRDNWSALPRCDTPDGETADAHEAG